MHVLLTRPLQESKNLAIELAKFGIKSIIDPLIEIKPSTNWQKKYVTIPKNEIGIIIFTSVNGLREFSSFEKSRDYKIAVVGKKTASFAKTLGYSNITRADDSASLLNIIEKDLSSNNFSSKLILYIAGKNVTLELAEILANKSYNAKKIIVYEALVSDNFSKRTIALMRSKEIEAVTLFSSRTAEAFLDIINNMGLDVSDVKVFALSEKIVKVVQAENFCKIYISAEKNTDSLISLIRTNAMDKHESQEKKNNIIDIPKMVHLVRGYKPNVLMTIIILLLISVGLYGFFKINHQLDVLADKIEEVQTDDSSEVFLEDDNSSNDNISNEKEPSLLNTIKTLDKKSQSANKEQTCSDYLKLISTTVSLKQKVTAGEAFQKEVVLLSILLKNKPDLLKYSEFLDQYSESGVPNLESLISEFKYIQNDIIIASRVSDEAVTWKYKILRLFSKFIFVKKTGNRALRGGGVDMIIEKTNNFLQEEDIASAILELEKITNEKAIHLTSIWLSHAKDNIEIGKKMNEFYDIVFNDLNCNFKEFPDNFSKDNLKK